MTFRLIHITLLAGLLAGSTIASGVAQGRTDPPAVDEQSQAWLDTLRKMKIKREEEEHRKLLQTAADVREQVEALRQDMNGSSLSPNAEKKLKEIEKGAKKIRSESGGGDNDLELDPVPSSLDAALKQLDDASARLQAGMEKTSRHIVSLTVVVYATEVIQLARLLRDYLK